MSRTTRVTVGGLAAALALGMAMAPPGIADEPGPGLVLHYDFADDNVDGATVRDLSSRGLDGTINNVENATVSNGVLDLPGGLAQATDAPFVTIPNGLFAGLTEATISTRVEWDGGGQFQWVYCIGKDAGSATFLTTAFPGDDEIRSSIKPVSGGYASEVGISGAERFPSGHWATLTTVLDGESITFYLDGINIGTTTAIGDIGTILHSDGSPNSGFLGKPFWENAHPYFDGRIDDFRVYDGAMTDEQVAGLVEGDLPVLAQLEETSFEIQTLAGVAPVLPGSTTATFSDGIRRPQTISWDEVSPSQYAAPGQFTLSGTVAGTSVSATVSVLESRMVVDLSESTGDFHGGASGTLYGIYGDGVPSRNVIDGINLRTVSTKAQDGPQHPGADALEVAKQLTDSSNGLTFIYMTDIYRGFPYQVPGDTQEERWANVLASITSQVEQVLELEKKYQDNIVFVPFNEPEGNYMGTGEWNVGGNPFGTPEEQAEYFAKWDQAYRLIKDLMPDAKVAGTNASWLYDWNRSFLEHTTQEGTVPEWFTWHELDSPATIRDSVERYRGWEDEIFAGTEYEGTHLPINLNEYANNYHTGVPGQIMQWIAAIEDSKVDGNLAYWNIDGNISDTAVESNRGNGQWWLLNRYSNLGGHTVRVTPPQPDVSYTLQGVATLDEEQQRASLLLGGQDGSSVVEFTDVDGETFGTSVHALVTEIPFTGQLGDSAQPRVVGELIAPVTDGSVEFSFGGEQLPELNQESAYEIVITPGAEAQLSAPNTLAWRGVYEAEDASHTGSNYGIQGPEGGPSNTSGTYTSNAYSVNGFHTNSDLSLTFDVEVPQAGTYDLDVLANSLNLLPSIQDQGPTNVFVTVNGEQEQELHLSLGYKHIVWGRTSATVELVAGQNTITLATSSLDGSSGTVGEALVDRIELSLPNPDAGAGSYEAEHAVATDGATANYSLEGASASGGVELGEGGSVTFWVYSPVDGEQQLTVDMAGTGSASVTVNDLPLFADVTESLDAPVHLSGGINKVVVTGQAGNLTVDRVQSAAGEGVLQGTVYEAEDAVTAGSAHVADLSLASGGKAVSGIGGEPGNSNTLTFSDVVVEEAGTYAVTFRYSNEEQSEASHYNPDPLARYADISVNGADPQRVWFPHSFHENNFWELTVPFELAEGANTLVLRSEELPLFDGVTYASDVWPDILLRSRFAANIDWIRVSPYTQVDEQPEPTDPPTDPTDPPTDPSDPPTDPTDPPTDPTEPPTARPAGDLYSTPGFHNLNGRWWYTACEPYSQTIRCRTEIWATQTTVVNGAYVSKAGWYFNNLTYLPKMTRQQWANNPLGYAGEWTAADGRKWRTECDTASTGRNGCRSYAWATFVASDQQPDGTWTHRKDQGWVFNNIVRFR